MHSQRTFIILISASASLLACGGDPSGQSAQPDAHGPSDSGSGSGSGSGHGSGSGSGSGSDNTPSAITLTGKIAASCTMFPAPPPEYDCNLGVTNLVMSPAQPTGTIHDAIDISSENKTDPDLGWISGLTVAKPSYPSACMQNIHWVGTAGALGYTVFAVDVNEGSCGLNGASNGDFSTGFSAHLDVTWNATGELVPATITFTP